MDFPIVDKESWFYKNCKRQRRNNAKICQVCPFRSGIEEQEQVKKSGGHHALVLGVDGLTDSWNGVWLEPVESHESNPFDKQDMKGKS